MPPSEEESDATLDVAEPFFRPIFAQDPEKRKYIQSTVEGVEIELPDFEALRSQILRASPLARERILVEEDIEKAVSEKTGMDNDIGDGWTLVMEARDDANAVHEVSKIEDYGGLGCPLLRFRAHLKDPACNADVFTDLLMNYDSRIQWDDQVARVEELYAVQDLDTVNELLNKSRFGTCTRLGVGYCSSKASLLASAREQLTLCGIQKFRDGSSIIWAKELESWHDHLLPPGERLVRSKSHVFAVIIVPTDSNEECREWLVEYLLQLEVGGMIPTFLTTTPMTESVLKLFEYAKSKEQTTDDSENTSEEHELGD